MSRLIDADALNLDYEVEMADDWKTAHEIANIVKYAPTIDAVSVVRCRECKHCNENYVDMTPPYAHNYCYKFSRYVNADDYCSYGEAKESE